MSSARPRFAILFLVLSAAIVAAAYFGYKQFTLQVRNEIESRLQDVASLKVLDLARWRQEQLDYGRRIGRSRLLIDGMQGFALSQPDGEQLPLLLSGLELLGATGNYREVQLFTAVGEPVFRLLNYSGEQPAIHWDAVRQALESPEPSLLKVRWADADKVSRLHLALCVPIFGDESGTDPIGLLALAIDPADDLSPYLAHWPALEATIETLLVGAEEDGAVLLSPINFDPGGEGPIRVGLVREEVIAVQARLGKRGPTEGLDYRGVPVIAVIEEVPGCDWLLVAKIDRAEAMASHGRRLRLAGAGALILIVTAAMLLRATWQRTKLVADRQVAEAQRVLERSQETMLRIIDQSNDLVAALDPDLHFVAFNRAFAQAFEANYGKAITIGHRLPDVLSDFPEERIRQISVFQKVLEGESISLVQEFGDSEETRRIYESEYRAILDSEGKALGACQMVRDVTEQKRAERRISQLNRIYAVLSGINEALVRTKDAALMFQQACTIAIERGGFRLAWVGVVDPGSTTVRCVASAGPGSPYLDDLHVTSVEGEPAGMGPSGHALRTGTPRLSNDIANDPIMAPWRDKALGHGLRSSAAIPIIVEGRVEAVYTLYSGEVGFFTEEEGLVMNELAADIAYSLATIRAGIQREAAVAALRESEERFRALFDANVDGIVVVDPDTAEIIFANKSMGTLLGRALDWFPGRSVTDLHPPAIRHSVMVEFHRHVRLQSAFLPDTPMMRSDGTVFDADLRTFGIVLDGRLRNAGQFRDVSERRKSEAALLESETRYRQLFEANPHPMWVYDLDTLQFLAVNDAAVRHYGYSRDEFLRMSITEIRPKEDVPALLENIDRVRRDEADSTDPRWEKPDAGLDQAGVWRHVRHDGSVIDVEITSHVLKFGDSDAEVVLAHDVTDRLRIERELAQKTEESERYFSLSLDLMCVVGVDGKFIRVNKGWEELLGYPASEIEGRPFIDFVHPGDLAITAVAAAELADHQDVDRFVNRYRRRDGTYRSIEWTCRESGGRIYAASRDVTESLRVEAELQQSAAVFSNLQEGVIITDLQSNILAVNDAALGLTGYSRAELLGKNPRLLKSGRHDRDFYVELYRSLIEEGNWRGEIWNRSKDGRIYPVWMSIGTVRNAAGEPTRYVSSFSDVSALKASEQKLDHLAHFDSLTGLANRLMIQLRLEQAVKRAERQGSRIGVLFIDLDEFKTINDSMGHETGDLVLLAVAQRLGGRVRKDDMLARLGGDEFLLLMEPITDADVPAIAARDMLSLLDAPILLPNGMEVFIGASIGISVYPEDGTTPADLMRAADVAMYQAKESGRRSFCFYTPAMNLSAIKRLDLEAGLRRAIEHDEFELLYQPKADLATGAICGAEALIRWNREGKGMVPPLDFISEAERCGLILPIGTWVIEQACRQIASWREAGMALVPISVNVSARQFRAANLEGIIGNALAKCDIPPNLLELELTESILMERPDEAVELLRGLKQIGVRLSLDDFGTGYSSLAYLSRFPIDTLKIDRYFIRNVVTDPTSAQIASAIIDLAHRMKLMVIAEGVETRAQMTYLRRHSCDQVQGYLLSAPITAGNFASQFLLPAGGLLPQPGDTITPKVALVIGALDTQASLLHPVLRNAGFDLIEAATGKDALEHMALNNVLLLVLEEPPEDMAASDFISRAAKLHPYTAFGMLSTPGREADALPAHCPLLTLDEILALAQKVMRHDHASNKP